MWRLVYCRIVHAHVYIRIHIPGYIYMQTMCSTIKLWHFRFRCSFGTTEVYINPNKCVLANLGYRMLHSLRLPCFFVAQRSDDGQTVRSVAYLKKSHVDLVPWSLKGPQGPWYICSDFLFSFYGLKWYQIIRIIQHSRVKMDDAKLPQSI